MVRSLHLAVGFPVVTHVLTPPPAHLAPCGPKRPAAPRHMSHCSTPRPCPMRHARTACNSPTLSKPRTSQPTHCLRISAPHASRTAIRTPFAPTRTPMHALFFPLARPRAAHIATHALPAHLCATRFAHSRSRTLRPTHTTPRRAAPHVPLQRPTPLLHAARPRRLQFARIIQAAHFAARALLAHLCAARFAHSYSHALRLSRAPLRHAFRVARVI